MYVDEEARARRKANDDLGDRIAHQMANITAGTHQLLTDVRAFDACGAWGHQGAKSMAHWLSYRVGLALGTAREYVRNARRLAELPLTDHAFSIGKLPYCKVREITRVATPANEALLIDYAYRMGGGQFAKLCQKYRTVERGARAAKDEPAKRFVQIRHLDDGMVAITAIITADEAELVTSTLDALAARAASATESPSEHVPAGTDACRVRPRAFDRADAFVAAFETIARGNAPAHAPIEMVVTVPAGTFHGAPELAATHVARRLGCDASMIPVIEDASGNPLAVGRAKRLVSGKLARALALRDPVCRFPGCSNHVFLHAHHVDHWADGGDTALSNLVNLCSFHHRCVHEYGFQVEMTDGTPRFSDPDGRPIQVVPEAVRATPLPPAIESEPACLWDGQPVSYPLLISALCHHTDLHAAETVD